ncbi:MAG: sulfotransferase [Hyphomicrobiaceae bacterium]|nr:sulfotransferase [Hyphomicrobiaceae bacterium]
MSENKDNPFNSPPEAVQARRQLDDAIRLLQTGRVAEAQNATREILGLHPEYVKALTTLGQAYLVELNHSAALPCFVRASMLSPDEPGILLQLAQVYFGLGSNDMARQTAEHVLELGPDESQATGAHRLLGQVFRQSADYDKAIAHLTKGCSTESDSSDTALLLGACRLENGQAKEAEAAFSAALENSSSALDQAEALYALSRVSGAARAKTLLSEIDALESNAPEFDSEGDAQAFAANINFGRAELLDRLDEHEDAWQALETANAPLDAVYSQARRDMQQSDAYTIERAEGWIFGGPPMIEPGKKVPVSLLLLGPCQSGKSALERLIGTLDGVERGYEHELVQDSARETAALNSFLPLSYPGQLPTSVHSQFTEIYSRRAVSRARGAKILTCTHPELIPDLGRIGETVPKLKVIFVDRDADDTALRIFGKLYPAGTNPFAYEVAAIYQHLESYSRLSDAWSQALGRMAMRVAYEDVVSDPKATLERVATFCELDASKTKLPDLGDGRGCAEPYRDKLERARSGAIAPLSGWAVPEL